MKVERKFYVCELCGKQAGLIKDPGTDTICCGQPMKLLKANSVDAAVEKHVPKLTLEGDKLTVEVGSVTHPMTEEHYIEWIVVAQGDSTQRVSLKPGAEPKAAFTVGKGDLTVYAYCNLHGLWYADL